MRNVVTTPAASAPPATNSGSRSAALRRIGTSAGKALRRAHAYERLVPALTGWDRTSWASAREQWFSEGVNRRSLEQVESASMFVVLSDETYAPTEDEERPREQETPAQAKVRAAQTSWTKMGRSAMHGNGADRWFDKSIQVIAYKSGHVGYCAEHSWADALAVAHVVEVGSMCAQQRLGMYNPDGSICREAEKTRLWSTEGESVFNGSWKRPKLSKETEMAMLKEGRMITITTGTGGETKKMKMEAGAAAGATETRREGATTTDGLTPGTGSSAGGTGSLSEDCVTRSSCLRVDGSPMFRRLRWHLPRGAERDIRSSMRHLRSLSDGIDLQVVSFTDYGKSFVKKCRVSPDAYVQAALQLAYYRDQGGRLDDTYEASVTRVFKEGRTETIRSVSKDSRTFVESMGMLEEGTLARVKGEDEDDDEDAVAVSSLAGGSSEDESTGGVSSVHRSDGPGTGGSSSSSSSGGGQPGLRSRLQPNYQQDILWPGAMGPVDGAPIMRSDASRVGAEEGLRRLQLLRASAKRHGLITARSRAGHGVDRHLFGLYIVSKGQDVESPFLAKALGTAWKLSTS